MNPEQWGQVKKVLDTLPSLDGAQLSSYLEKIFAADPGIAP